MAAPRPKPTHLRIISGNPSNRPINEDEPTPTAPMHDAPDWLSDRQKRIWNDALLGAPAGLLSNLDVSAFVVWVVAFDTYQQAVEKINKSTLLVRSSVKGEPLQNPYLAIQNKQAQIMIKAAAELGFTPSGRSKVRVPGGHGGVQPTNEFAENVRRKK